MPEFAHCLCMCLWQSCLFMNMVFNFIQNAFWSVKYSDPNHALSWDRLHNYSHGLGGKHLWPCLKKHISELPGSCANLVDHGYIFTSKISLLSDSLKDNPASLIGLGSIISLMCSMFILLMLISMKTFSRFCIQQRSCPFTDFYNLQLAPFVLHNILTQQDSPSGFLLLCCLRSYLELNAYAQLHVHTDMALVECEAELRQFSLLIKVKISSDGLFFYLTKIRNIHKAWRMMLQIMKWKHRMMKTMPQSLRVGNSLRCTCTCTCVMTLMLKLHQNNNVICSDHRYKIHYSNIFTHSLNGT